MKRTLKALSILFNYPGEDFASLREARDTLLQMLSEEDEEAASLIHKFLSEVDPEKADENYVAVFELPATCPLYAHYYTIRDKQSQVGSYLLEIKAKYKIKGYDMDVRRELPDFLPVMLEFLAEIADEDPSYAASFADKYILSWLDQLEKCLEKHRPEYTLLTRALRRALARLKEGTGPQPGGAKP